MTMKGPVLQGRGPALVEAARPLIAEAVADDLMSLIRTDLRSVLRNPTGRFQSQAPAMRRVGDDIAVDDGGVVYGPWLEGVGSRNARSRFKGYSTFRRMRQVAQGRVTTVASPVVADLVRRLG